jgi:hypothetical protein
VSIAQGWREDDIIKRVPIVVTGNDFSTLFAPLVGLGPCRGGKGGEQQGRGAPAGFATLAACWGALRAIAG